MYRDLGDVLSRESEECVRRSFSGNSSSLQPRKAAEVPRLAPYGTVLSGEVYTCSGECAEPCWKASGRIG